MLANVEAVRRGLPSLTAILSPDGEAGASIVVVIDSFARPRRRCARPTTSRTSCHVGHDRPAKGGSCVTATLRCCRTGDPPWLGTGWLHGAPLFTFAGMSFIFNPMKMGLCAAVHAKFDVDHWFDVVEQRQPMMAFNGPAMAES